MAIELDALIQRQKDRVAKPATVQLDVALGGKLVTFELRRFETPMEWLDLTAVHPPREGSQMDRGVGFNAHAVAVAAVPRCGSVVDGDARIPVTAAQWAEIVRVLDAPDLDMFATALWGLHVFDPKQQKKVLVGKARAAKSKKKRS